MEDARENEPGAPAGTSAAKRLLWRIAIGAVLLITVLQVYWIAGKLRSLMGGGKTGEGRITRTDAGTQVKGPVPGQAGAPQLVVTPPVSTDLFFPDLALGLVCIDGIPDLRITPGQAKQLLPLIKEISPNLETLHDMEARCHDILDDDQAEYIRKNIEKISDVVLGTKHRIGKDPVIAYAMKTLRARASVMKKPASAPKSPVQPEDTEGGRPFTLNYMDVCFGVPALERTGTLALRDKQVLSLIPLLESIEKLNAKIRTEEREIRKIVNAKQASYIRQNLKSFYGKVSTLPSAGEGGDIVSAALLNILRQRVSEKK